MVQRGVSVLRADINASLNLILNSLIDKKELLIKFYQIEKKISEILRYNREDDIYKLITDETDIIERIHLIDYDISSEKDYLIKTSGRNFETIILKIHNSDELAEKLKKTVSDSMVILAELAELKKTNMETAVNYTEDLSRQIRELEIMNSLTIIPPKDLQSL